MRDLDLGNGTIVPADLLRATTSRSSGPGGQNVNKVESRVTIEVVVDALPLDEEQKTRVRTRLASRINKEGVLRVTSQSTRSQVTNRDHAIDRIESLLRDALKEEKPRKKTKVSASAKRKRIEHKKKIGEKKKLRSNVDVER
jgi:ribosome-associated protein